MRYLPANDRVLHILNVLRVVLVVGLTSFLVSGLGVIAHVNSTKAGNLQPWFMFLFLAGVIMALCLWGLYPDIGTRHYLPSKDCIRSILRVLRVIYLIVFTGGVIAGFGVLAHEQTAMTHSPIPWIVFAIVAVAIVAVILCALCIRRGGNRPMPSLLLSKKSMRILSRSIFWAWVVFIVLGFIGQQTGRLHGAKPLTWKQIPFATIHACVVLWIIHRLCVKGEQDADEKRRIFALQAIVAEKTRAARDAAEAVKHPSWN